MQGKGFIFRALDLLLSLGTEFCPPRGPAPARSHILQGPVLHVSKCKACQLYKGQKKKYGHLPVKNVEAHPWQTLCVDLILYTVCTKTGHSHYMQ
jgi:hypothetical protein